MPDINVYPFADYDKDSVVYTASSQDDNPSIEFVNAPLRLKTSIAKMVAMKIKVRQGSMNEIELQQGFATELKSIQSENKNKNRHMPDQVNDLGYLGFMAGWGDADPTAVVPEEDERITIDYEF